MLSSADTSISDAAAFLGARGVTATFIVPTETALRKGIIDATATVRRYLSDAGVHEYEDQPQGEADKVILRAWLHYPDGAHQSKVSLYRPTTKKGDPRIWFSGLPEYARPGNLLAVFARGADELHVVNMSDPVIRGLFDDPHSELAKNVRGQSRSTVAEELVSRLRDIALSGWVRSMKPHDTGVGFTLESLLGIAANSSKSPDYKGIELKSRREAKSAAGLNKRITLFSQVPAWDETVRLGGMGVAEAVAAITGDPKRGDYHCTVYPAPNPQGVCSRVSMVDSAVQYQTMLAQGTPIRLIHAWLLSNLQDRLMTKHKETFFIAADVRRAPDGTEEFLYRSVLHTARPVAASLEPMLREGTVTLDYTYRGFSANGRIGDHGYLFKTTGRHLPALMASSQTIELL